MSAALAELIDLLVRLHLLDAGQIDETRRRAASISEPKLLARDLIDRGWLTPYQANLLLQERGDELLLGSHVLLDKLGEGGMGTVYRACNWKLGRSCAIKLIRKERLSSPDAVRRFYREIRAAAQLEHPNVVRADDADEVNGTHFFVMEYVDGVDLARLVREHGPLPPGLACEYIRQAALGLQHAHERGLVHRDIKPANLLLARSKGAGTVKVLDMGLARQDETVFKEHSATLTQVGTLMGTPDYMAPEQSVSARTVDIRADLYSLGCSLYFLLTGSVPFSGGSMTEKLLRHRMEQPQPIEMLRPDVPPAVADAVYKLMAKKPAERYQTPAELAAALECIVLDSVGQTFLSATAGKKACPTQPESPTDPFWQGVVAEATIERTAPARHRKRWALIGTAAAALVLLIIAIVVVAWPSVHPDPDSNGTRTQHAPVPDRCALEFDGIAAHVAAPDFKYQGDHPLTLECWAMPRSIDAERDVKLFSNQEKNGLGLAISKGVWLFRMHDGAKYCDVVGGQARAGSRVHVAGVFDNKEMRLYVDGKLQGQAVWAGSHKAGDMPLLIGANPLPGGWQTNHFAGIIDEVRISRVARYSADFTPSRRFEPDVGAILLYHFDEGDNTIVRDVSEHGYHGTINGAKWVREDAEPSPPDAADSRPPLAVAPFDATKAKALQLLWANHLKLSVEETNSIGMKLVLIPPGEFDMGSTEEEVEQFIRDHPEYYAPFLRAEAPRRRVTIPKPFRMGTCEVTVAQYRRFVEESQHKAGAKLSRPDEHPVGFVTRSDAEAFCAWLSKVEKRVYRLPAEVEWEYACRAGTTEQRFCGAGQLREYAWVKADSKDVLPVGALRPNPFGLYDVYGNACELCSDNPRPTSATQRDLVRGGSAGTTAIHCRSAARNWPQKVYAYHGFRVVCEIDPPLAVAPFDAKTARDYQRHRRAQGSFRNRSSFLQELQECGEMNEPVLLPPEGPNASDLLQ